MAWSTSSRSSHSAVSPVRTVLSVRFGPYLVANATDILHRRRSLRAEAAPKLHAQRTVVSSYPKLASRRIIRGMDKSRLRQMASLMFLFIYYDAEKRETGDWRLG